MAQPPLLECHAHVKVTAIEPRKLRVSGSMSEVTQPNEVAPEAHGARLCVACGRPLRGKQQTACSAVCRAKASRLRNPDPATALRHALQSAPRPLNPASYTEAACITLVREYASWHATVRAGALGKERPSP